MKISSGSKKTGSRGSAGNDKPVSGDEVLARNQAARKNSRPLLDPHGIYGTRSAYRVRTAQRRRRVQTLSTVLGIVVAGLAISYWLRENRIPRLRPLWRASLAGQPVGMPAWGTWAAAKGIAPGVFMVVPTERGSLLTIDASNGQSKAVFSTGLALRAQPLVVGATAYAPCDDGSLFAIDWQRGKVLWNYHSGATISARPSYVRLPASVSADALTPAAPVNVVVLGDDAGTISALSPLSGKPLWRKSLQAPAGNGLTAVEGVTGGASKVLVPFLAGLGTEGGIACLDATTGHVLWRAELGAAFLPAPVVQGNSVAGRALCVGDNGSVIALDMATGRKLWKTYALPLSSDSNNAVVMRGEPLLVNIASGAALVCGANDGGIRAFDAQNGRLLWTFATGTPVRSRPRLVSLKDGSGASTDVLLIGSDSRYAFGLEARSGELLWRCETSGTAFATPGVHEKAVICLTREGNVESFALPG